MRFRVSPGSGVRKHASMVMSAACRSLMPLPGLTIVVADIPTAHAVGYILTPLPGLERVPRPATRINSPDGRGRY